MFPASFELRVNNERVMAKVSGRELRYNRVDEEVLAGVCRRRREDRREYVELF